MKKVMYSVAIVSTILLTACGAESTSKEVKTKTEAKTEVASEQYACPMKCEGDKTYTEAGECPKCHMALVEVKK